VLEVPVELGAPYQESEWLPLEYALGHHSHATEQIVLLLVPEVDYRQTVVAISALRFDVAQARFLPASRRELGLQRGLAPRYADVRSGPVGSRHVVFWSDFVTRSDRGLAFESASGTFRDATPAEIGAVPARDGLATHAAYPPAPEPVTGVAVNTDYLGRKATFTRAGRTVGTLAFPTIPGAFVGAFGNTKSALFWDNGTRADQARLPPAEQRSSYLVHVESGSSCRVARDLAYPATAVFRGPTWIVFVNAHRNEVRPSDCPPGAPCVAPEQSHFERASLVLLRDRG
jgi:hypothetical protein